MAFVFGFRFWPNFLAVLDDFFFGFAFSNIPQCPPQKWTRLCKTITKDNFADDDFDEAEMVRVVDRDEKLRQELDKHEAELEEYQQRPNAFANRVHWLREQIDRVRAQRLILQERGLNPTPVPVEQRLPRLDLDVV